ncbi:hypothetical protein DERF_002484 [Dermatophagoides farinae]|uniref:Uncharacterized protein n=1 Tax=Dermatophagoides farinae TaxID=6954 RepID=A0A922ICI3_DERFA|nr:hypothetical protein DERF_002484 [Dermatophagoides farinae]
MEIRMETIKEMFTFLLFFVANFWKQIMKTFGANVSCWLHGNNQKKNIITNCWMITIFIFRSLMWPIIHSNQENGQRQLS